MAQRWKCKRKRNFWLSQHAKNYVCIYVSRVAGSLLKFSKRRAATCACCATIAALNFQREQGWVLDLAGVGLWRTQIFTLKPSTYMSNEENFALCQFKLFRGVGCSDITNTQVGISGETVPEGGNLHIYWPSSNHALWWVVILTTNSQLVCHTTLPPVGGVGSTWQFLIFWIFL